jgi:anaerobic dimethyl sulfoxide reductase subunit B (iron-sulfur subunit)
MAQKGFYFDSDRCTSCKSCIAACKDKNETFVGIKYRSVLDYCTGSWVKNGDLAVPKDVAVYGVSYSCMHCSTPACAANCSAGAIIKREEDGVVYIDPELCIGCGVCVTACPYAAPRMNAETNVAGKCDFCRSRIDNEDVPACVDACLMRCLEWGDIDELRTKYGEVAQVAPLPDPAMTGANYVINPSRFAKEEAGGSVVNSEHELI